MNPFDTLKTYALLALGVLVVILGISTTQYRRMYHATATAYTTLNESVVRQNREATDLYEQLKGQYDKRKLDLDAALDQNRKDKNAYDLEMEKLRGELAARPTVYRVRLVPGSCGASGGSTTAGASAGAGASPQTDPATTGLLDPEVGRRLDALKLDMESLQGDFNVCRAHALAVEAATKK